MTPEERGRLDAGLIRASRQQPGRVVGVLIRTTASVGPQERAALDSAGLVIGSVAGRIVTGRVHARAVPDLARLPFVDYMELARTVPAPRPPVIPIDTGRPDSE